MAWCRRRADRNSFRDATILFSGFALNGQGQIGLWASYALQHVVTGALLDFGWGLNTKGGWRRGRYCPHAMTIDQAIAIASASAGTTRIG